MHTLGMTVPGKVKQFLHGAASGPGGLRVRPGSFVLAVAVYLSLALLAAQTLGLLHGILHSPAGAGAGVWTTNESSAQRHTAAGRSGVISGGSASVLTHLFTGHLGDAECRAYDQLSHVDAALGTAAVVLPLLLTPLLLSMPTGLVAARWHALFQARGPPSLR